MPAPRTSPELDALLARRPADLHWLDAAALSGFFFAVAAAPETIPPGAWLEMVFGDEGPDPESPDELDAAVEALFGIYHEAASLARTYDEAGLPGWIEVRPVPEDNVGGDAPLASWSRGFAYGHAWLDTLWDVPVPEGLDRQFGSVFACLVFFGLDRQLPAFMDKVYPGREVDEVAAAFLETFPEALTGYARMGRAIEEIRARLEADAAEDGGGDGDLADVAVGSGFIPRAAGPGDPCPCGSGLPYARCCGKAVH